MEPVRPVRRNPYPQVSVLPDVRHGRRSPARSGQSVRKLWETPATSSPWSWSWSPAPRRCANGFKSIRGSPAAPAPTWTS